MIENVDLTRRILEYIGGPETPFPLNLHPDDIVNRFPDEDRDQVLYSLHCAAEARLLDGAKVQGEHRLLKTGERLFFLGMIYGLTPEGRDYVAGTERHWSTVISNLKESGKRVTTMVLKPLISRAVKEAWEKIQGGSV